MGLARLVVALAVVGGCSSSSTGAATQPPPPTVPIAATQAGPTTTAPPPGNTTAAGPAPSRGAWIPGKAIVARGRVSNTPWQHLVGDVPGKSPEYFDLEEGGQTVVYLPKPITCPGLVDVEGTVKEVRGTPKRPGGPETKVDDSYGELHIDVTAHRCLSSTTANAAPPTTVAPQTTGTAGNANGCPPGGSPCTRGKTCCLLSTGGAPQRMPDGTFQGRQRYRCQPPPCPRPAYLPSSPPRPR